MSVPKKPDVPLYQRDGIYLEDNFENPKHIFILIGDMAANLSEDRDGETWLDVGCATGEFAYYLKQKLPGLKITNLDNSERLLEIGRARVSDCDFIRGDVANLDAFSDQSFNFVSMLGVMGIFDDFEPSLGECLRVAKDGGSVFVFNTFNEHPVDVRVQWRFSGDNGPFNSGQSVFSKESVISFLEQHPRVKDWDFREFILPFDLPKRDDVMRAWTELDSNGERIQKNGLGLTINQEILTVSIK